MYISISQKEAMTIVTIDGVYVDSRLLKNAQTTLFNFSGGAQAPSFIYCYAETIPMGLGNYFKIMAYTIAPGNKRDNMLAPTVSIYIHYEKSPENMPVSKGKWKWVNVQNAFFYGCEITE